MMGSLMGSGGGRLGRGRGGRAGGGGLLGRSLPLRRSVRAVLLLPGLAAIRLLLLLPSLAAASVVRLVGGGDGVAVAGLFLDLLFLLLLRRGALRAGGVEL